MAIRRSFGGATILKPGAYSRFKVDNSSGSPLAANDTLFLIGEAEIGAPGSVDGIVEFNASRLGSLVEKYGSGPLVDAAIAAVRPSNTPGVGGVGRFLVYKTNAATQASATLDDGGSPANDMFTVKDRAWGAPGNDLSVDVAAGSSANQRTISITKLSDTTEDLGENAAQDVITLQYTGDASTAVAEIAGLTRSALTLTTTLAGDQTDGSADLSITLSGRTMKQLVDLINAQVGYVATLETATLAQTAATELDPVAAATDITSAIDIRRIQREILDLLNTSERVQAEEEAPPVGGVPAIATTPLSGGLKGGSSNTDFSTGLSDSLGVDYNVALPCVSRDAADDVADAELGFTDASSSYTISSVIASLSAHLSLRGQIKNRKEAQGMAGLRDATKATAFAEVAGVASENVQVAIQDVIFLNAAGELVVGQPHIFAAMAAGIRLGTDVGEPLTHKTIRALQVGHVLDPATGLPTGDFDPILDVDEAIENGVLFSEPFGNAFRIVVDNTTYGLDQSFVFNRGSVVEASYFVFRTLRETAEQIFVGRKVSNGLASSIKEVVRNRLRELNAPDVQIITSSDDAPEGFREDTFVVTVSGNTATVQVEFKPVQGLDFVFFDFTLGDIQQSA